jgi:hypothetical protein
MSPLADHVFSAALALPPASRAALADLLRDSLLDNQVPGTEHGDEMDADLRAQLLTAHFHEAKRIALRRAEENRSTPTPSPPGTAP